MIAIPTPGQHGGDGPRVAAALGLAPDEVLDLSASLNPVAPDPVPLLRRHLDAVRRYPDPTAATAALAEALRVDPSRVVVTNGGAEAIALVAAELPAGWVEDPDFSLYGRHLTFDATGARWRSDPHNPTGLLAGPGQQAAVWDEAFYPLATGTWTSGRAEHGAVVLGSLTKLFACPGLRVGFVLAPPGDDLAERVRARQPRWALNALAAEVVPALLATADLPAWACRIRELRAALVALLREHGFAPFDSDSNYVLVPGAVGLRSRLASEGVVVRDCSSFGLRDHVRIAVPDDSGRARLAAALQSSAGRHAG